MNTTRAPTDPSPSMPGAQDLHQFIKWLVGGWRLFRRAPLSLLGLMLLLLAMEIKELWTENNWTTKEGEGARSMRLCLPTQASA
ncbi:MAG: hypothetical protein ACXIUL_12295 [Wenzhouxiangella sp.]